MEFEGWGSSCFQGRQVSVLILDLELDLETNEIGPIKKDTFNHFYSSLITEIYGRPPQHYYCRFSDLQIRPIRH